MFLNKFCLLADWFKTSLINCSIVHIHQRRTIYIYVYICLFVCLYTFYFSSSSSFSVSVSSSTTSISSSSSSWSSSSSYSSSRTIDAYLHWRREATANYLRRQLRYTHRNRCSTISHQHQLYCAMQRRRRMLDVLEMNQPSVLQPLHVRPSIHQPLRPSPSFAYTVRIPLLPPTLSRKVRFQTRNCWESLLDKCHPGNHRIMQLQPDHDDNDTHIVGQK